MLLISISKDEEMRTLGDFSIRVGAIYKLMVDVFCFLLVGVFGRVVAIFIRIKDNKILWYKAICPRFFSPLFIDKPSWIRKPINWVDLRGL